MEQRKVNKTWKTNFSVARAPEILPAALLGTHSQFFRLTFDY